MKVLAIVPALNCGSSLSELLPKVREYGVDILVVDDGSTDDTADVALAHGAKLISHTLNRGKGAALKAGFAFALDNGYDAVLTLDADGQHDPKYIPRFLEAYRSSGASLLIGSRMNDKADMPLERRLSNWLTSRILTLLLGTRIEDSQCGYRLLCCNLLKTIRLECDRFELETEVIIKAIRLGYPIAFVPIRVEYGKKFPSYINACADTLRWCRRVLELI